MSRDTGVLELQNDGSGKINRRGAGRVDVYFVEGAGEISLSSDFQFYAVDSKPYRSIGLKAVPGTNKVTLSWNEIENAERFVVKQLVNGIWVDRKVINGNVCFAELDGLVNGQEYIYAVDVYVPIRKTWTWAYRYESGDQVAVTPEDMCAKAKGELAQSMSAGNTASEKVDAITEDLSKDSMALAMQEADDTLQQIEQLENQYAAEKTIETGVTVDNDTSDMIDQSKVSMIGGAINVDSGDAKLNISRPKNEKNVDHNRYANPVQLDIKLMNSKTEKRELRVPVRVTIPIPFGLNLDKLILLHYLPNGMPETVDWINNGDGTISFVTKHFSTFVFANDEGISIDEDNFPDEYFRAYVDLYIDTDQDGKLSQEEADAVKIITCAKWQSISSLKGIEYFKNLKELDCSENCISELDISNNLFL